MSNRETIATIITAVVLIVDLITDYFLRLKYRNVVKPEGSVKHRQGFVIRVVGLTPAIILGWLWLSALLAFAYWHLFDGGSNLLWKNNWFRIGTTSDIDKAMRKYPVIIWFKYLGLIASIILFIFK